MFRIGILISGRGSNMMALADAVRDRRIPGAEVSVVISDQRAAAGLEGALARGLKTIPVERAGRSRAEHDREIAAVLLEHKVDLVCLAGYMRLLSAGFIETFRGRIINIHPSLLPAFPGLEAQRQALEHGVRWTGCTVHFVDEELDAGPILLQQPVPVHEDDTVETLSARILEEEHRIYPEAVAIIAGGLWAIEGRRVLFKREK